MKSLKSSIFAKILVIVFIGLLLTIPTVMIEDLIHEREYIQREAINEVSSKWGGEQTISGPLLSIPYQKYIKQVAQKDSTERLILVKENIHILPSKLVINGDLKPEQRNRGIYEIVVYNSKVSIAGEFSAAAIDQLDIPAKDIQFDKANIEVGISDLRGIEEQIVLNWNGQNLKFNSGTTSNDVLASGINAQIKFSESDSAVYTFQFDLDLKGSQLLYFSPLGETTDVTMSSSWSNPSFNGAFLPDRRTVSADGFTANWNVLHLNRNYPQSWVGQNYSLEGSSFGVDLLLPVDNYQKSIRSIKYAILFIAFTFIVFFFVEVLNKVFIHPVQYILVGIALVVFYTLLLSISEHLNYNLSFIISAIGTLALIVGYVKAILKSNKLALLIGGILLILYCFIFVIIQLQDYALLIGSVGLFIILTLVMYYSRKIDWYNLNLKKEEEEEI